MVPIQKSKKNRAGARASRVVTESRVVGAITLQRERVRCGQPRCGRCPHGPYWYAYAWNPKTGRLRSFYIGRELGKAVGGDGAGAVDESALAAWIEAQSNSKRSRRIAARAPRPKRPSARAKTREA